MKLDEELREAARLEAAAPYAIAQILITLPASEARLRVLRAVEDLVRADASVPGILERYVKGGAKCLQNI